MKITVMQDFLRSGGTERQSVLLSNAFARAGHDVSLLTFRPGGQLAGTVADTVKRRSLQPFDLGLDWFAPGRNRAVATDAPEILLCMGRMANCYAGGLQRRRPATRVIATMRTGKPLPHLFRQSLHTVSAIVANSRDARDTLVRDHGVEPGRIAVIHNSLVFPPVPADPTAAAAARQQLRAEHGAGPSTTVLLCVAMFRPEKNQRELVEIAAGLPPETDWQLWLAGHGPAREACERRVAELGLTARVRFLGFVRDPSSLYRAADIAVHASWSEALSNFLIEAQAHGRPVVAYQAQGIEECFVPGDTGWAIRRDDRDAFRAAVGALAEQTEAERAALALSAERFARETFDPERQVAAYLELFQRLVRRAP